MKIADCAIGLQHRPKVVAEMSGNHNGSLERALKLVRAAKDSGAHFLKLQTYTADTLTLDVQEGDFLITEEDSLWQGRTLHSLYEEAHTPLSWHKPIMDCAHDLGVVCFSSVFAEGTVKDLERLNVPAYKIASQECVHHPLIREVARTGKPIIMSTGMASLAEIDEAVNLIRKTSSSELLLMKCTSSYPATPEDSHVLTIPCLRNLFDCEVGLSDHTAGIGAAVAAVAHGATMIEKHFTLDRRDGGVDSAFSIEPDELQALVIETERAWQSLGEVFFGPTEAERSSLSGRRSIYFSQDLEAGQELTRQNIRVIRPNKGLAPKFFDVCLGRKARHAVAKGTPVTWDAIT